LAVAKAAVAGGLGFLLGSVATAVSVKEPKPPAEFPKFSYNPEHFTPPEAPEEFSFTFYRDVFKGAFNRISSFHTAGLRARGYRVRAHSVYKLFEYDEVEGNVAIIHPLFSPFLSVDARRWGIMLKRLKRRHVLLFACDVADSTHIAPDVINRVCNSPHLDGLFVPSTFSASAYRNSGMINPVYVLPHGVSPEFSRSLPESGGHNPPRILFFGLHSLRSRKGGYVVAKVMRALRGEGYDFTLTVKIHAPPLVYDVKSFYGDYPTTRVAGWLSERELVELYDSCDLLIAPHRGGAYELNVFEALARGLPVITTGFGGVMDYVSPRTAYLIRPAKTIKVFPRRATAARIHTGWGVEPDLKHATELTRYVLDNLEYCKKRARSQAPQFQRQTWDKVVDRMLDVVVKAW